MTTEERLFWLETKNRRLERLLGGVRVGGRGSRDPSPPPPTSRVSSLDESRLRTLLAAHKDHTCRPTETP